MSPAEAPAAVMKSFAVGALGLFFLVSGCLVLALHPLIFDRRRERLRSAIDDLCEIERRSSDRLAELLPDLAPEVRASAEREIERQRLLAHGYMSTPTGRHWQHTVRWIGVGLLLITLSVMCLLAYLAMQG